LSSVVLGEGIRREGVKFRLGSLMVDFGEGTSSIRWFQSADVTSAPMSDRSSLPTLGDDLE